MKFISSQKYINKPLNYLISWEIKLKINGNVSEKNETIIREYFVVKLIHISLNKVIVFHTYKQ